MSRRYECYRATSAALDPIAPAISFGHNGRGEIADDDVVSERCDYARTMCARYPRQSTDIEMIVVAVRHQNEIDGRQVGKGDPGVVDALWTDKAQRRGPLRPHWIEQNVQARRLNKKTGVANIRNPPSRTFDAYWGAIDVWRWRPDRPLRFRSTAATIDEPTQQITPALRRCSMRVEEPSAVEVIRGGACVIALRHGRSFFSQTIPVDRVY